MRLTDAMGVTFALMGAPAPEREPRLKRGAPRINTLIPTERAKRRQARKDRHRASIRDRKRRRHVRAVRQGGLK